MIYEKLFPLNIRILNEPHLSRYLENKMCVFTYALVDEL